MPDVWSSQYTWGGNPPPQEGEFVVVPASQTLLIDEDTPVLKMILIQGGTVIFDEKDIHLQTENILITDGGALQVVLLITNLTWYPFCMYMVSKVVIVGTQL